MFGHSTYLLYVLFFCLIPIAGCWITNFRFLRGNARIVALTALIIFLYMCLTDPLAEYWRNWYFSSDRLLGPYMLNFPIEEGLFFLLVPVAVASVTLVFLSTRARAPN
jgi:lycopene cyclase domain-containing protein